MHELTRNPTDVRGSGARGE